MPEITLAVRTGRPVGSSPSRRLRAAGQVPGVVYGHGIDPVPIALDARELRAALTSSAGANALLALEVDGTTHLTMAKELQRHPVRGTLTHVDFVVVRRDEVVRAEVPVTLVGEAESVHRADGVVDQQAFTLAVRALPADIPGAIEVDVSGLSIGDAVRVGDLRLPAGVEAEADPDQAVVVAHPPQVTAADLGEEVEPEAAEAGEAGPP
ncbi:MAG: 50S ribosomal protein L25, partial [Acidimicrobiales bacterium]